MHKITRTPPAPPPPVSCYLCQMILKISFLFCIEGPKLSGRFKISLSSFLAESYKEKMNGSSRCLDEPKKPKVPKSVKNSPMWTKNGPNFAEMCNVERSQTLPFFANRGNFIIQRIWSMLALDELELDWGPKLMERLKGHKSGSWAPIDSTRHHHLSKNDHVWVPQSLHKTAFHWTHGCFSSQN